MPGPAIPTLTGDRVVLEPLAAQHAAGLAEAVRDGALWELPYATVPRPEGVPAEIERRLALHEQGSMLPFTVRRPDGRVVGMTTYMNMDLTVPRVEIGSTWLAASAQRTGINTEAKLLLLDYAFDQLDCVRVEIRTHARNDQSRRAIERLGAQLEGILRRHMRMNGQIRDTAVYAILDHEWPAVRAHLQSLLTDPPRKDRP